MARRVGGCRGLLSAGDAYGFDGFVAAICRLAEPDDDTTRLGVDFSHALHLLPLFARVPLVDAESIHP